MAGTDILAQIVFNLILIITTLPALFVVMWTNIICNFFPGSKSTLQPFNARMIGCAWKCTLALTCCIVPVRLTGMDEVCKQLNERDGKPRLILFNHLSFFDTMLLTTLFPFRLTGSCRMMASEHLFKMPVVGTLVAGPGHLKIPFKNHETKTAEPEAGNAAALSKGSKADFSVDKEAVAKVMQNFEAFVGAGNIGAWFPEGRLNPHPKELQQFRAGGFALATRLDCSIHCCVFAGIEVFWNRKAPVGGKPANVGVNGFELCSSSFDLIKELSEGKEVDEKAMCILIANHAQKRMQEERDRMVADNWVSQLPDYPDESADPKKEPLVAEMGNPDGENNVIV
jgi:1-acyl-sn-glycerol-3-phosphate acyltransferase